MLATPAETLPDREKLLKLVECLLKTNGPFIQAFRRTLKLLKVLGPDLWLVSMLFHPAIIKIKEIIDIK